MSSGEAPAGADISEYVSCGYFLSRYAGTRDCTGVELRRVSLASDHTQRKFFPGSWALAWCGESRNERVEEARVFGISERELDAVIAWADGNFDKAFGAWLVFFELDGARAAATSLLRGAVDLELWGLGLHRSLASGFCAKTRPPDPQPGFAPVGAGGIHVAACQRGARLQAGGTALGHEVLVPELGCILNSPESRHLDERGMFRATGVVPNAAGLIDSLDDAVSCCRYLDSHATETQHDVTGWMPFLIVRYAL